METDAVIKRLLRFRLTKFAYAFCLGLKGNPNPSREQQAILARIVDQHSQDMSEISGNTYEHTNTK